MREPLTEGLFLRVSLDLLRRLDEIVERERSRHPGRKVSRSDVVREILYRGVP